MTSKALSNSIMPLFFTKKTFDDFSSIHVLFTSLETFSRDYPLFSPNSIANQDALLARYLQQSVRRDLRNWRLWSELDWIRIFFDRTDRGKIRIWAYGFLEASSDLISLFGTTLLHTRWLSTNYTLHYPGFNATYYRVAERTTFPASSHSAEVVRQLH